MLINGVLLVVVNITNKVEEEKLYQLGINFGRSHRMVGLNVMLMDFSLMKL